jgi:hypothetical protein
MSPAETQIPVISTRARGLTLPADERGVHAAVVASWERHQRNLSHVNPKTRQKAWDAMAAIERGLVETPDCDWRQRAIAETIALARGRGEEVEPGREGMRTRILSRGGFDAARRKGYLDGLAQTAQELWDIGQLYQDCFERVEGLKTPERTGGTGRGRGGPQHALLHCAEVLAILRNGLPGAQVVALDLICALDLSINLAALVTGRHRLTMAGRLREGLCAAHRNWRARPKESATPSPHTLALRQAAILAAQKSVA